MKYFNELKRKKEGYFFILPGFIYMVIILGYPLLYNVVLSLKNVNIKTFASGNSIFIGLQNYFFLFQDPDFIQVLKNTFVFTVSCIAGQFVIGFFLALFFSQKFVLSGCIRGLIFIVYMLPMSVTALLGKNMFDVTSGVINDILMKIGVIQVPVEWLLDGSTAMLAVIIVNCWVGIPFNMLLFITGLTGISREVYESAQVDGANSVQRFAYITLPLMKSSIMSVLMLGFIYTFKVFDLIFVMTSGGPINATEVLGTFSYSLSFNQNEFSMGAATAMVLFACLFVVGLIYLRIISKEDN